MDVFEPSTRSDHFDTVCGCCCLIGFIVDKTQTDYGVTRLQRASVLCVCVFLCVCVCVCVCDLAIIHLAFRIWWHFTEITKRWMSLHYIFFLCKDLMVIPTATSQRGDGHAVQVDPCIWQLTSLKIFNIQYFCTLPWQSFKTILPETHTVPHIRPTGRATQITADSWNRSALVLVQNRSTVSNYSVKICRSSGQEKKRSAHCFLCLGLLCFSFHRSDCTWPAQRENEIVSHETGLLFLAEHRGEVAEERGVCS